MAMHFNLAAAALLAALAAAAPARAQTIGQAPLGAPAVPQSHSVEQADARLAEVARNRAAVEAEYNASEQVCYGKFFVNSCLDHAKEKRRVALSGLRAVEVEANYFKRKFTVDQRDRELAERLKKDEEDQAKRAEAAATAIPRVARDDAAAAAKPAAKSGPTLEQRQAAHDAKVKAQQAQEAAEAPKRAESVAAFEKKKAESEKRQADVAAKKAAREEKLRKQQAEAAAKAAAEAAKAK